MRIAILGAGPIGIEAAIHAEADGHEVVLFEAGSVGASLLKFGHVQWFSPWRDLTSRLGRNLLENASLDSTERPLGSAFAEHYLAPLARRLDIHTSATVRAIGRSRLRKHMSPGAVSRKREAFRLLIDGPDGEFLDHAEAILDCTGVTRQPLPAGVGGIPAPGETAAAAAGLVQYGPVPVHDLAGARVVVVGDGTSAVRTLDALLALDPAPRVTWITRDAAVPGFSSPTDDPLPPRQALWHRAQTLVEEVNHMPDFHISRFRALEDGTLGVTLTDATDLKADRVLACTGFQPDWYPQRELQIETSWSLEAPAVQAEALRTVQECGPDAPTGALLLKQHEPNYFVLGAKSWGRRADFRLRVGHRQVLDVLELL